MPGARPNDFGQPSFFPSAADTSCKAGDSGRNGGAAGHDPHLDAAELGALVRGLHGLPGATHKAAIGGILER